jgi:hypothetical protein
MTHGNTHRSWLISWETPSPISLKVGTAFFDAAGYELKDNSLKTYDQDKRSTTKTTELCFTLKERYSLTLRGTEHFVFFICLGRAK